MAKCIRTESNDLGGSGYGGVYDMQFIYGGVGALQPMER